MTVITYNAQAAGTAIKSFRDKSVSFANASGEVARETLKGFLAEQLTATGLVTLTLAAFGNPKTPKGKALEKLTSSGDHIPGFGAARKEIAVILQVAENLNVDGVRAIAESFCNKEKDAPKSLRALASAVFAAVKAANASALPEGAEEDAEAENEANATDATETGSEPVSATYDLATVAAYIARLSDDEMANETVSDGLNAVLAAIRDRTNAFAATLTEERKAA